MKLSTCLILRDEGETIYKCLDSCKTITDEYIIGIDHQTKDNTKDEVMRFFCDNPELDKDVYEYSWADSFSEARNYGMDMATGDYILIMDGHEYFPETFYNITENKDLPIIQILSAVKEKIGREPADEVFFYLYQQPFTGNVPNNYFLQPRIYRNGKGDNGEMIRFGRASHNVIQNTNPDKSAHYPEVIIIHDAPDENRAWRKEQRIEMNTKRLEEDIAKNEKDSRAWFYLGNTHLEARKIDDAINAYDKYLSLKSPNSSEKYQCYYHYALALKEQKKNSEAIDKLYKAVRIDPTRRDAYLLIGDLCEEVEDHEKAIHNYNSALMLKPKDSRMFSNGAVNTWMPFERLSQVYEKTGDYINATLNLKMAQRYLQPPEWEEKIKAWSRDRLRILIIDSIGSFTKPLFDSLKQDGHEVIQVKGYDNKLAAWADVIWQEWGDANILQNMYLHKTIMRIHGYEAYVNQSILQQIDETKLKGIVCVAQHIADILPFASAQVIQNGVDCKKFYNKNTKRMDKSIGYAGLLNAKKNPMRLADIIKNNSDYNFHLRVTWQDQMLESAFKHETKDCDNIVYHGWYDDLNDFWNKVEYVISTSDIESFSFNVGEGIASGCKPLIYNWKGAKEIWGEDKVFYSQEPSIKTLIKIAKPCRDYVVSNFNEITQIDKLKELIYG